MRILVLLLTILLFSGSSLAECRNKDCMTAQFELETLGHTFHYDEVFNIGTNLITLKTIQTKLLLLNFIME